jgi:hypothetical protein
MLVASLAIQPFANALDQLTLTEVQTGVFCVDHQDVLINPARSFDSIQVSDLGL